MNRRISKVELKSSLILVFALILLTISQSLSTMEAEPIETITGELQILTKDHLSSNVVARSTPPANRMTFAKSETIYYLRTQEGKMIELVIPENLMPPFIYAGAGKLVRVQAIRINEQKYEVKAPIKLSQEEKPQTILYQVEKIQAGIPPVIGPQRTWVLLVKFKDIPDEPMSPYDIQSRIFSYVLYYSGDWAYGLRGIIESSSYGKASVIGKVVGWYNIYASTNYGGADLCTSGRDYYKALVDAVDNLYKNYKIKVENNDRIILYFNVDVWHFGGCAFAFLGYVTASFSYGTRIISVQWMPTDDFFGSAPSIIAHEYGHQMGLMHTGYVYYPYDSPWDIMSGAPSGVPYKNVDFAAIHKFLLGWLTLAPDKYTSVVIFRQQKGVATINSLHKVGFTEIGLVIINIDNIRFWTIEVRSKNLVDKDLPAEGVIVHYVDLSASGWFAKPLDRTPGDNNLANANFRVDDQITDTKGSVNLKCKVLATTYNPITYRVRCPQSPIWTSLAFTSLYDPASVSRTITVGLFNPHIFAVGQDYHIYRRYADWMSGELLPWELEMVTISSPSVSQDLQWEYEDIMVVTRDSDSLLWYAIFTSYGYRKSGWASLDFSSSVDVAVAYDEWTATYHIIASDGSGTYHRIYNRYTDTWNDWVRIGPSSAQQPAAHAYGGYLHVAIVTSDGKIFYNVYNIRTNEWSTWRFIASSYHTPAIHSYGWADYGFLRVLLVFVGTSNTLYAKEFVTGSGWTGAKTLSIKSDSKPTIVCGYRWEMDCYLLVKNIYGGIYYKYFDPYNPSINSMCNKWILVGSSAISPPTGGGDDLTSLYIIRKKSDNTLDMALLS